MSVILHEFQSVSLAITSPSPVDQLGFQVRTIQEAECSENLCVVFSGGAAEVNTQSSAEKIQKISKVKMYVEGMEHDPLARMESTSRGRDDIPYVYKIV